MFYEHSVENYKNIFQLEKYKNKVHAHIQHSVGTDLSVSTVVENAAAGAAMAALPSQMVASTSSTAARPVRGASGRTIARLRSAEMASSVKTEQETER